MVSIDPRTECPPPVAEEIFGAKRRHMAVAYTHGVGYAIWVFHYDSTIIPAPKWKDSSGTVRDSGQPPAPRGQGRCMALRYWIPNYEGKWELRYEIGDLDPSTSSDLLKWAQAKLGPKS